MSDHVMSEEDVARRLAGGSGRPRRHNLMDKFINGIELIAAFFVGIVAADIFISVLLRYFFSVQIPDAYDFGRLLLGILIFWGMAVASYRGDHISVDLLWGVAPPWAKRAIDTFSSLVTLVGLGAFTWMFALKVIGTRADNVETFDLRQPVWIYYFIAWIGLASAVLLLVVRTARLVVRGEALGGERTSLE